MNDCDELRQLDRDITDAWIRSPNAERLAFMEMAERTANELLELRHEMTTERIVRA